MEEKIISLLWRRVPGKKIPFPARWRLRAPQASTKTKFGPLLSQVAPTSAAGLEQEKYFDPFFSQVTRTSAAGLEQEKNGPFLSQVTPTSAAGLKQEKFWVPFFPDGAPAAHAQKKIWTPFGAGGASSHRRKKNHSPVSDRDQPWH